MKILTYLFSNFDPADNILEDAEVVQVFVPAKSG